MINVMGQIESSQVLRRHRLTVEQYHRMAEAGVLAPEARVELIEGELFEMATVGTRHASAVKRLNYLFTALVGDQAIVSVQDPLRLGEYSEPEPDLMLLRPRADFYADAHPVAADVLLLIEVSDSTVRYDREIKLPLYARYEVPEVWIVDLNKRVLRLFAGPVDCEYTRISSSATPEPLAPLLLSLARVDLAPLLR